MQWSIVLNAAMRSSSASNDTSPLSVAILMPHDTLASAVSVEWFRRYVDCTDGMVQIWFRWTSRHDQTRHSRILDVSETFDIGQKLLGSSTFSRAFFSSGVTMAFLNLLGTYPFSNERLKMWASRHATPPLTFFKYLAGNGSSDDCLLGAEVIIFSTSSSVTCSNSFSHSPVVSWKWGGAVFTVSHWTFSTF